MKSVIIAICLLIPLIVLLVIIDRKNFYSTYDVVAQEETVTRKETTAVTTLPVEGAGATKVETVPEAKVPEVKSVERGSLTETKHVEAKPNEDTDKNLPYAVPVLTAEKAIKANEEALGHLAKREIIAKSNEIESFPESTKNKHVPMAVPVLNSEEAIKANREAIRFQRNKEVAAFLSSYWQKIGNNNRINFIISLLPLLLIFDVVSFRNKKKRTNRNIVMDYIPLSRRMRILFSVSLLAFGILVFVPWSVYFGNSPQFPFIFQDFVNWNLRLLTVSIIGASIVLLLIPPIISDYLVAIIAGLGLCVYIQPMFMNQYLGTMDGNEPVWSEHRFFGTANLIIWVAVILLPIILRIRVPQFFSRIISIASGIILFLEIIATSSMLLSTSQDVWSRPTDTYYVDGSNQFQLSKKKNVVVFVMDNLASTYVKQCFEKYPETKDIVKDFIWFADARSNYHMTFPGLIHELTGSFLVAPANSFLDLLNNMWNSPSAKSFYKQINDAGYDARFYINKNKFLIGQESCYHDFFSNIAIRKITYIINYERIHSCLMQMSGYSYAPYILKKHFFYTFDFSDNTVQKRVASIPSFKTIPVTNTAYLNSLYSSGISSDASKPVFSFHYTYGVHAPWIYDEKCNKVNEPFDNPNPTTRGCFYIISEFIRFLKEEAIYDNTAILLCSDHGGNSTGGKKYDMSFMIKPFGENKPELTIDTTKVQSIDILPTLLYLACGENADFKDFDGFAPNNIPRDRVRKVYNFYHDKSLPPVDPDLERNYPGCQGLLEYILSDSKPLRLGVDSDSLVRKIPLLNSAQKN